MKTFYKSLIMAIMLIIVMIIGCGCGKKELNMITEKLDKLPEEIANNKVTEKDFEVVKNDGFVVLMNGNAVFGENLWKEFIDQINDGEKAAVKVAMWSTLSGKASKEYVEQHKEEYPKLFLSQIAYDGEKYTISPLHKVDGRYVICEVNGFDSPEKSFRFLKHFTDDAIGSTRNAIANSAEHYVLTDDESLTLEKLNKVILGLTTTTMQFRMVYSKYDYVDGYDPNELIITE